MTDTPAAPAHCFVPYPAPPGGTPHAAAGPLSGLCFAMKDIYDVAGYPTGCGNPHALALSGIRPASAPVVDTLLAAGAAFVGKVVTDELAFSMNGKNAHFGAPRNGAAPDRIAGGSSSGSASAVSNGLCDFAIGSDTGGSVRAPASHCGLIGLRPTHGRIPLAGCMPLSPGFDTCGWFARDIATFGRVGRVLLGEDGVLLLPTMPQVAPLLAEPEASLDDYRNRAIRMLCLAGLSGCPQLSLPLMSIDGVPLGFSLIGPPGSDGSLIARAAQLLES